MIDLNSAETDKEYLHKFEHGTCHILPPNEDYDGPEWIKWRADHPGQWQWRPLRAAYYDADGHYIRPGPWFNPDGTKVRYYDANKVAAAFTAFQKAVKKFFPQMDGGTLAQAKALVAAWERKSGTEER
jgi:hypothetical protein